MNLGDIGDILLGKDTENQTTTTTGSSAPVLLFGGFVLAALVAIAIFTLKN